MYFIGIIIFMLGFRSFLYFIGAPITIFLNPSMICILLFSFMGVVVATSGFKTCIRGLNALFSKKYFIADEERMKAVELFRLLSKTGICVSFIAMLSRLLVLRNHSNDVDALFHIVGAAALAPVFGLIVSIVIFEPAIFILKNRKEEEPALVKAYPKQLGDRLLELCHQNGFSAEDILNATDIELKKE